MLAPGGLVFVNAYVEGDEDPEQDEILALDAESLQLRYRFGLSLLNDAHAMAVVGDESELGAALWTVALVLGAYLSSYASEGYEPHKL